MGTGLFVIHNQFKLGEPNPVPFVMCYLIFVGLDPPNSFTNILLLLGFIYYPEQNMYFFTQYLLIYCTIIVIMQVDDEIRLNIIEALLKELSVTPNIRQIQKHTGYHKATIKSSLEFLKKEGLLHGFGPKIDFKKFGYKLEVVVLYQADISDKETFQSILETAKSDPNLYRLSSIIGSSNWNLMAHHIYRDVESYHKDTTKKYYEKIPKIFNVLRDRQIFYENEPFHKVASRTKSMIEIIRKEKGIE